MVHTGLHTALGYLTGEAQHSTKDETTNKVTKLHSKPRANLEGTFNKFKQEQD